MSSNSISSQTDNAMQQFEQARTSLAKLPMLGPALWLYGRDPQRKYAFMADIDWLTLPPLILDQCKLFLKQELPWAFFTWAFVDDRVHERLLAGNAKIAPHEWKSGEHAWIVDAVAPFGELDKMVDEIRRTHLAGKAVHRLIVDSAGRVAATRLAAL